MEFLYPILGVILSALLGFILKNWVTEDRLAAWQGIVRKFATGVGIAITLGLSRYPWSKMLWNRLIEPVLILVLDAIWMPLWTGLKTGLLSDEPSLNGQSKAMKQELRQR